MQLLNSKEAPKMNCLLVSDFQHMSHFLDSFNLGLFLL